MLIGTKSVETKYRRSSKLGKSHTYIKTKIILVLRCDSCGELFERDKSKMSVKRQSNSYFHVCANCDVKRFAQRKGVERRFIWEKLASSSDDISKI